MKRNILFLAGLMMLAVACTNKESKIEVEKTVKVASVEHYDETSTLSFPGKVKAASDVNLSFRIAGPIVKMHVDVGTYVKKGQVLAEIDARDYATQLTATEAEYNQIKAEADRVIALYEKNAVTPNDYEKGIYGLQQITAKLNAHQNALADTKLRAQFDGYVQKIFYNQGETVGAGMPVVSVISSNLPEVEINIPSSEFIRRDKFDGVSCVVDIYPDVIFPLEIIGVTQKANLNQLYIMRLKVKGESGSLLKPGMATTVSINLKSNGTNFVKIPLSAVFEVNNQPSVWVYSEDDKTVKSKSIKIKEIKGDGTVVVSEGLKFGETVVVAGVNSIHEGETVKLLPAVSDTNVGGLL